MAAYRALQEEIPIYPPRARALIETLCVEDRAIGVTERRRYSALERLAAHSVPAGVEETGPGTADSTSRHHQHLRLAERASSGAAGAGGVSSLRRLRL